MQAKVRLYLQPYPIAESVAQGDLTAIGMLHTLSASRDDKEGAMAEYRLLTVWWTAAVTDRVWEALASYATWPTWWRGIRSVEVLRRGDESGVGTVLRQRWRSRVPYTLVFDLEMLRIEGGKLLDGRASGDLVGTCKWTLATVNGGTELRFNVDVRTGQWWMNLPIPFAPRVVRASFETIMSWGREGLARTLGAPVELRFTTGEGWRRPERMAASFEE
jgi:hypothetical protein